MLKGFRWPVLVLGLAVVLLAGAIYVRFIDGEPSSGPGTPAPTEQAASTPTPTQAPDPTSPPATPVPEVVPASRQTNQPTTGQFVEGLVGRIGKLNPLLADFNPVDRDISALIFEGLTTTNDYGEAVPLLAERWGVSPDGLDYVFALRRDVLWHDGVPFTSADVAFTINVMRSSDFPGDRSLTAFWRTVEMTVIDEYTIRFRLVQPLALFPEYLRIGMLPAHVLEDYPVGQLERHPFNLDPIGTGPYQFEALLADGGRIVGAVLRAAPTYRQRHPEAELALDRLIFRTFTTPEDAIAAFVQGQVNAVGNVPPTFLPQLNAIEHLAIHTAVYPTVGMLIYNWERDEIGYLREQRARIALTKALDRAALVSQTLGQQAVVATSPLIPGSWAYQAFEYPATSLDEARAMLEDVDFTLEVTVEAPDEDIPEEAPQDGESGEAEDDESEDGESADDTGDSEDDEDETTETIETRRSLTMLVLDQPERVALAAAIGQRWNEIGFTVEVEAVDEATFRQRLQDGDFDTALVEYDFAPLADPDSYAFWHVGQHEDGQNYGAMRDLRISEVLEKARRETVGLNRSRFYQEFQQLFAQRVPALPLYYPVYVYLVDDRLDGVQLGFITSPADRFRGIADWDWSVP